MYFTLKKKTTNFKAPQNSQQMNTDIFTESTHTENAFRSFLSLISCQGEEEFNLYSLPHREFLGMGIIGRSKGGGAPGTHPGCKFFSYHAVFRENLPK